MKKVLILLSGSFPYESPYALRVQAFIQAIVDNNTEVIILCDNISGGEVSNCKIYSLDKQFSKLEKIISLPRKYRKKVKQIIEIENPDIVISSSMYNRFSYILKVIKNNNMPLILESCEWYDPSTFKYGILSHHYIMFSYCWKYLFPKADGVIAISRLLEKHYKEKCDNVIRIPTILNIDPIVPELNLPIENKIRLLFAGALARTKDSVKPFFEAFYIIGEQSKRFEVCICGVELEKLKTHLGQDLYNRYKDIIICKGRVPQQTIADEYRNSHFGIFMRPLQRSSNAGFSTKLGEGMSLGTPFIINDTSDIALYIKNGENGFVVDVDPHKISEILKNILKMTNEEYNLLRVKARKTAEKDFNCNSYSFEIKKLIEKVLEEEKNG